MKKAIDYGPKGVISIPPSKSYSHRAIIAACLANTVSMIKNITLSEDVTATIEMMKAMGANVRWEENNLMIDQGICPQKKVTLDAKESGSSLRLILPIACLFAEEITLKMSESLQKRPLEIYENILAGNIQKGHAKRFIHSPKHLGNKFVIPGNISSQFISGLLFALPLQHENSTIEVVGNLESKAYVDMTLQILTQANISVKHDGYRSFYIPGKQKYEPFPFEIEGDYSQASFFLIASAIGPHETEVVGLKENSLQGDRKILDILSQSGCKIRRGLNNGLICTATQIDAMEVDISEIPDLVTPLTVYFSFANGISTIKNGKRLRFKESDRLLSTKTEINRIGGNVLLENDDLTIFPVPFFKGGNANAWNDHRIAMSLAVCSLRSKKTILLEGYQSVHKSYPRFWSDFEKIKIDR